MAVDSQVKPSEKRIHIEISESGSGPFGIDGTLVEMIEFDFLPGVLRRRLPFEQRS